MDKTQKRMSNRDPSFSKTNAPRPSRTFQPDGLAHRSSSASRSPSRSRSRSPSIPIAFTSPVSSGQRCGINGSGINPKAPSTNWRVADSSLSDMVITSDHPAMALRPGVIDADLESKKRSNTNRTRKSTSPAPSSSTPRTAQPANDQDRIYDGVRTLDAIEDSAEAEAEAEADGDTVPDMKSIRAKYDPDSAFIESPSSERSFSIPPSSPSGSIRSRPPPPAPSAALGPDGRPLVRKRRTSSITRKPSPGVTPKTVVDWEIPRKTFHSSIGFVTLFLWTLNPPTVRPLITVLSAGLIAVTTADFLRFNFPSFREQWETWLGFLMRESERDKINGVVWYLVGVIWVLSLYPRDIAVVAILTLSWSDTTASTIGRLWGRYTPPLPSHLPGVPAIRFAPRKSLAGFLAATVTGMAICMGFWHDGSHGRWAVLESTVGWLVTSLVVGVGGAVVEALDLGLDDNLTLPILSGALIWAWLALTNILL